MQPFSWSTLFAWLDGSWESLQSQLGMASPSMTGLSRIARSTAAFPGPLDLLTPVVGLAAALASLLLAGVAIASLGTLLASLLGLGFLLTEVFGLTIELDSSRMPF